MKALTDFKKNIHTYYHNNVANKAGTDENETWQDYWEMIYDTLSRRGLIVVKNGQPLPEGCEILTKEAYSDLCLRASKSEMSEQERWLKGE